VSSESAITTGTARTFEFTPQHTGDHAYRSGVLKWAVTQGLWGILRVVPVGGGIAASHTSETSADKPDSLSFKVRAGGFSFALVAWVLLALLFGWLALKEWLKIKAQ
jgi:hypothetical protein